jgi:pimeloyl-ACP methyl ester carboxylesterase
MKIQSAKAIIGFFMFMVIISVYFACADNPTDMGIVFQQRTAEKLEELQPDELAQYISGVDGEVVVQQTANTISVYEILKAIALADSGGFTYTENISIVSSDGVKISANVFSPKNMGAGPFPAVVFINSWGMDEYEYQLPASALAKKGYVALSYSARGFGKSGGVTNFGGPKDTADMTAVLDYLGSHFPVDRTNIAVAGISYGGMCSLLALPRHSRIKTAACLSGPSDFARGMFNQDAVNAFCITMIGMGGATQLAVDPDFTAMLADLKNYTNISAFRSWAVSISPSSFIGQVNASGKPVYISHNFSDEMFISNSNIDFYARLTVPKKLDLNQGIHASAEAGGLLGASNYVWNNVFRWFDYHLKGIQNGIMSEAPVTMEKKFDSGRDNFEAWPSVRVKNNVFYLHPRKSDMDYDGEIKTSAYSNSTLFNPGGKITNSITHLSSFADTIATTGIPLVSQILESFVDLPLKVLVDFINPVKAIVYKSERFDKCLKIRGVAKLHLNVSFSGGKGLLVAYLYDVNEYGSGTLLTHGVYGVYDKTAGQITAIDMELSATAYDLPAGHRLAIVIDTVDPLYGQPADGSYDVNFRYANNLQSIFEIPGEN